MRFHWQNLNEDRFGNVKGSGFWHGRAWLGRWRAEWKIPCRHAGISFDVDDEGATFHLGLLLFSVYLSWEGLRRYPGREFKVYFMDGGLWFALWSDPMQSCRDDPWYRRMHVFRPLDLLLGRRQYSSDPYETRDVLIPMPEGAYPATVTMSRDTWKRPRSPFRRTVVRADIKCERGIPFEGKGENSWDCGEDAAHGLCTPAENVEDAIGKMVATVMRDRRRYGTPERLQPLIATV